MPRRDVKLTVVLGDGPNLDNSWDQGIAVAADGHDTWGMINCKVAGAGDDIIGWTIRPQSSGDITTLRTMLDGTIEVKLGPGPVGEPQTIVGDALWLMNDESGRLTKDSSHAPESQRFMAFALEAGKLEDGYCEVYVFTQKFVIIK